MVALVDPAGSEFARGLTNYSAADLSRIKGLRTEQIAAALGHCPYVEVIHRDNMALTSAASRVRGSGRSRQRRSRSSERRVAHSCRQ